MSERTAQNHAGDRTAADAECARDMTPPELDSAQLAVLHAAIDVQGTDQSRSPSASEVRTRAEQLLNAAREAIPFQARGGSYDGIEAQIWELKTAGYVEIDVGLAPPTAPGMSAHVYDEQVGVRATALGRWRVASSS